MQQMDKCEQTKDLVFHMSAGDFMWKQIWVNLLQWGFTGIQRCNDAWGKTISSNKT